MNYISEIIFRQNLVKPVHPFLLQTRETRTTATEKVRRTRDYPASGYPEDLAAMITELREIHDNEPTEYGVWEDFQWRIWRVAPSSFRDRAPVDAEFVKEIEEHLS